MKDEMLQEVSARPSANQGRETLRSRFGLAPGAWLLTLALFAVLVALTVGLWQAEARANRQPAGHSPALVLWGGLAISLLMSATVLQSLLHRARAQQQAQRHLQAIETLNAISAAIGAHIGAGTAMDELARAAQRMLDMALAGVSLVDFERRTLEIIAAAGAMPPDSPRFFSLDQLPACDYCLRTNEVVFEEDVRHITRPYSLEAVRLFGVVSMILIPLQIEGRPIGLMTLSSPQPRKFSQVDRRIAQLLASQASVIVSNTRLLEQTRRDAQAKMVLLRQLNDRVRNNLAGIVALLGMDVPKMPSDVRMWLDRVRDRIRTMASAHQLFGSGMNRIALEALLNQTLAVLSGVKRPGTIVTADLEDIGLTLATEQAVALAMVIHELCYNAFVHGLVAGGTLVIRGRHVNGSETASSKVRVEIEDDGRGYTDPAAHEGNGAETAAPFAAGRGLELVDGLVRRELRGQFQLRPRPGGGTLATIEFPAVWG